MNIVQRGDRAVKPPSLPSDSPYTPQSKERQSEERQSKVQSRVRRGCGYYKHLVGSARAIISELRLDESYKRAVLGMIARTIDGKVIHRDEFLERLSSLRSEIEARAQRESRSDLCYWLKRRLFPAQKRVCARCKAETDGLIEGLCSQLLSGGGS
jgi:hypothetical protein